MSSLSLSLLCFVLLFTRVKNLSKFENIFPAFSWLGKSSLSSDYCEKDWTYTIACNYSKCLPSRLVKTMVFWLIRPSVTKAKATVLAFAKIFFGCLRLLNRTLTCQDNRPSKWLLHSRQGTFFHSHREKAVRLRNASHRIHSKVL